MTIALVILGALALGAIGMKVIGHWWSANRANLTILAKRIDTRANEDAAAKDENDKGAERAGEVLRASSSGLAARVDELRAIGRGEKPPGTSE